MHLRTLEGTSVFTLERAAQERQVGIVDELRVKADFVHRVSPDRGSPWTDTKVLNDLDYKR